jgi:hypothetical protein
MTGAESKEFLAEGNRLSIEICACLPSRFLEVYS